MSKGLLAFISDREKRLNTASVKTEEVVLFLFSLICFSQGRDSPAKKKTPSK
jgi:hypothetical protein